MLTRLAVNYVNNANTNEKHLLYRSIDVDEKEIEKYKNYDETFIYIFSSDHISSKIHSLVSMVKTSPKVYEFIFNNQWILGYAASADIQVLKDAGMPITITVMDVVSDAYIDDKYNAVYYSKKSIPTYSKSYHKYMNNIITWLFTAKVNTFDERLDVLTLTNNKALQVIKDNPWILMYTDNENRLRMMHKLSMPFTKMDVITGFNQKAQAENLFIPLSLKPVYESWNHDIIEILKPGEETIDVKLSRYCYEHSAYYRIEDNNSMLRNNLWLLDFVEEPYTKKRILELLGLEEVVETKKMISICPKDNRTGLFSNQLEIDIKDYKTYKALNRKLLQLFQKGENEIDEHDLVSFINSDTRVLDTWPWLVNYVTNPSLIMGIRKKV